MSKAPGEGFWGMTSEGRQRANHTMFSHVTKAGGPFRRVDDEMYDPDSPVWWKTG